MGLHRRVRRPSAWPVLALVMPAIACFAQPAPDESYAGIAEASAAVALDERHFVVAEDECNTLLVYARGQAMPVGKPIDLAAFLKTEDKASDLEGGAIVGDVVYWISSHSLPKSGKPRAWRKQFFATTVSRSTSVPTLHPHGQPYTGLLDDMIKARTLRDLKLADAARRLPEEPGGLNIEGLAAGKAGGLLIGFRNPLIEGKAPVVPLKNPAEVVQGDRARFDTPILLDLAGRGIRSIDRVGDHYLIVAGPVADAGTFALFRWSGSARDAPALQYELPSGFSPEALVPVAGSKDVDLLSDDGSTQAAVACGSATKAKQMFRTIRVRLP